MKKFISFVVLHLSSLFRGIYAGKIIGFLDFCREVICGNQTVFAGKVHRRMDINNIIPSSKELLEEYPIIEPTNKIKVRIVFPEGDSWNNIHSLYDEFSNDDRFQTYVLILNENRFVRIMKSVGCRYVITDHYSLKDDKPDILIACFYGSYDKNMIFPECRKYIKRFYSFIPSVIMNEMNNDIHWKIIKKGNIYTNPDRYIVDPLVYNALKGYVENDKLIKMGGCQFDELYNELGKNHVPPQTWDKLQNKIVYLWATDHGLNESYPKNGFTVDLYLGKMLKYFSEHLDKALIFRPHPQFIREMMRDGHFWSMDDLCKLKSYINSTPNVVWDDSFDFCCAYNVCDALIVDANCSIICSFLTTGKPICRLMREDMKEWLVCPELYDCYYYAHNFDECIDYINLVHSGNDPKKLLREDGRHKAILHFDGSNGVRMKNFIADDYLDYVK